MRPCLCGPSFAAFLAKKSTLRPPRVLRPYHSSLIHVLTVIARVGEGIDDVQTSCRQEYALPSIANEVSVPSWPGPVCRAGHAVAVARKPITASCVLNRKADYSRTWTARPSPMAFGAQVAASRSAAPRGRAGRFARARPRMFASGPPLSLPRTSLTVAAMASRPGAAKAKASYDCAVTGRAGPRSRMGEE